MPNMNDPADTTFYYTAPLFLPSTLDDNQFLGIYDSESTLPTGQQPFTTAGIKGTGSMYVYLNDTWNYIGQYLHDAYRYLVHYQATSFASATGTKWSSIFDDIAANETLMNEFANDNTAITNIAASSVAMNSIAASSTAMNAVGGSTTAMNAIMSSTQTETWWGSSYYVGKGLATYASLSHTDLDSLNTATDIAASSAAMTDIWESDIARQTIWKSPTARLAVYNNSSILQGVTVNSTPNLVSETPLSTDATAGYLTYNSITGSGADWTAVNINDSNKYIVWIHFYSDVNYDWYQGKIANYDQTTNLQTTDGGSSLTRGNMNTTSAGLWVYFVNNSSTGLSDSYARVWYIQV